MPGGKKHFLKKGRVWEFLLLLIQLVRPKVGKGIATILGNSETMEFSTKEKVINSDRRAAPPLFRHPTNVRTKPLNLGTMGLRRSPIAVSFRAKNSGISGWGIKCQTEGRTADKGSTVRSGVCALLPFLAQCGPVFITERSIAPIGDKRISLMPIVHLWSPSLPILRHAT